MVGCSSVIFTACPYFGLFVRGELTARLIPENSHLIVGVNLIEPLVASTLWLRAKASEIVVARHPIIVVALHGLPIECALFVHEFVSRYPI